MHEHASLTGSSADLIEIKRVLEAALLVAGEPVSAQLARQLDPPIEQDTVRKLLDERSPTGRTARSSSQVASGWRFQGLPAAADLSRSADARATAPRYSRAR